MTQSGRSRWVDWPPILLAAMAMVSASLVLNACGQAPSKPPRAAHQVPSTAAPSASNSPTPAPLGAPVRLEISHAHVDAPIQQVGVDNQGNIGIPSTPSAVAWYDQGPAPGQPGDAIINGHLDWTTGPAVFWNLGDLRPGDEITVVTQQGQALHFHVTAERPYDASSPPPPDLFAKTGPSRISLITCTGPWDEGKRQYQQRLVVSAQRS